MYQRLLSLLLIIVMMLLTAQQVIAGELSDSKVVPTSSQEASAYVTDKDNVILSDEIPEAVQAMLADEEAEQSPQSERTAYLTFDDGPSDNTEKILDILREEDIKATFFVVYREGYADTYRRIVEEGHSIGLHSYTHDYEQMYVSEEAYYIDLFRIEAYVEEVTGAQTRLIRFPGGSNCAAGDEMCEGIMARLRDKVHSVGYEYYDWNIHSGDVAAAYVERDVIVGNVKRQVTGQPEITVLMHDSPAKMTTVEALPEIIAYLREQGYACDRITEAAEPVHF